LLEEKNYAKIEGLTREAMNTVNAIKINK